MNSLERLKLRIADNEALHAGMAEAREAEDAAQSVFFGEYAGFDATAGRHQVKLPNGAVVACISITNGAFRRGDRVSVSTSRTSTQAFIDGMPQ